MQSGESIWWESVGGPPPRDANVLGSREAFRWLLVVDSKWYLSGRSRGWGVLDVTVEWEVCLLDHSKRALAGLVARTVQGSSRAMLAEARWGAKW